MLGSASEAEDVIQDAWLRARQDEDADVRSLRASSRGCASTSDGGGKAAAATRPVLGADRIAKFVLGHARKRQSSESDFQLVTINGAPGLLMRHPASGLGTYSFDIVEGRIRAIYVVHNPDKLPGFLERVH
jgi:RNA polymerase sigma-70 factor (ECF subfamily)